MRKVMGVLFVAPLALSALSLGAGPAGSAVKGPTCKTFKATVHVSPALPKLGSKTVVSATVTTVGAITGCSGGGVKGAAFTDSYKYKGNCTTFVTGKGGVTTAGPSSLSWSNGKSSSAHTTATLASKPGVTPVVLKLSSTITGGQFAGMSTSGKVRADSPPGTCRTIGLGSATLTGTGTFTFK